LPQLLLQELLPRGFFLFQEAQKAKHLYRAEKVSKTNHVKNAVMHLDLQICRTSGRRT
jgi:hypothetical protein